ncbi:conserved hypothetical protein, partial [Ricinus communis]
LQRRRRGAGLVADPVRPAGPLRLQGGEHRRQPDRPHGAALAILRLGGGQDRRHHELGSGASGRRPDLRRGRLEGLGDHAPRRAQARLAQRRLARGRDGRRAGRQAGRPRSLRRRDDRAPELRRRPRA